MVPPDTEPVVGIPALTWLSDGFRGVLRALALGGLLAIGSPAAAQVALEWDAPAPCPTRAAVAAHVARLLAGSTAARTAQPVAVKASVRALDAGYVLELVTDVGGEHGERRLQAPSCAELAAASAVIVALLVDPAVVEAPAATVPASTGAGGSGTSSGAPQQAGEGEASEAKEESGAEAAEAEEDDSDSDSDSESDSDSDSDSDSESDSDSDESESEREDEAEAEAAGAATLTHVLLRPELVLDIGALPYPSLGPGLALGARLGSFTLELAGKYGPRQHVRRDQRTVAELEHAAGALALCYALPPAPLLSPCARVEYGRLWGEGRAVRTPEPGGGALVVAELALRAYLPLAKSLALSVESGLALPLGAPLFTVAGVGPIHEPGVLLVRLRAGVEVRL
jgi:hypothetical protein